MICRRLKYENTFLVVKDEMNIRRARSHSPKMTTEDLDTTPVRSRESAKYYVSLLEAFISDPGSKLPETVDSPPKRGEKMKGGPSQRAAGRCGMSLLPRACCKGSAETSYDHSSFKVPCVPADSITC